MNLLTVFGGSRALRHLLIAAISLLASGAGHAASEADFKWDLSYQDALAAHPIASNEFMQTWPRSLSSTRAIKASLAAYTGEPIEAAMLLETPDGHAGDPTAHWIIKTRSGASVCTMHVKVTPADCQPLDPARTVALMRSVSRLSALPAQTGNVSDEKGADGRPILLNYLGFLSVYVDGVSLQRPIATIEMVHQDGANPAAGRLQDALAGVMLSSADLQQRKTATNAGGRQQQLNQATISGDPEQLRVLLEQPGQPKLDLAAALPLAAANNRHRALDVLLTHGAGIDANQGAALKAAVKAGDEEMVRHVLERGAQIDPVIKNGSAAYESALRVAVQLDKEDMAQLLIALGADVNAITSACDTVWLLASNRHNESMKQLLVGLGADPGLHQRCQQTSQRGAQGSSDETEARARNALSTAVFTFLRQNDYARLDALYASVKDPRQVTPAGRSKLGIFYYSLRMFPNWSRDPAYWSRMHAEAAVWKKKNPRSVVARMFEVDLHLQRLSSFRGTGNYDTLTAAERAEVTSGSDAAFRVLTEIKPMMSAAKDPEWYRAMLNLIPNWHRNFPGTMTRTLDEGAARYPAYHDMYFMAALFQSPDYDEMPDARDLIARHAGAHDKEAGSLYARVYWYLDQVDYHGKLFDTGFADWPTLRDSFSDMVALYPDPWNLNAYAYFACMAKDYTTMRELLDRIGAGLVFSSWGESGAETFAACEAHKAEGGPAARARFDASQAQVRRKRLERNFYDFIRFSDQPRRVADLAVTLAAQRKAAEIDQQLGRGANMMAQYHIGTTLAKMGRHEEAISAFTLGLKSQPEYHAAFWRRGMSYAAVGRKLEAQQDFADGARVFRRVPPSELAVLSETDKKLLREMQQTFREAGFDTPGL